MRLKAYRWFNFGTVKKWPLFVYVFLLASRCLAQEGMVTGIIFDKDNKYRIASVNVKNVTTDISVYNNLKGEFKIKAKVGDQLIFYRPDYHRDTVLVQSNAALAVYMPRMAIQLNLVTIHDTMLNNPERRLAATKEEYSKIYGSLAYDDLLSTPSYGSAGLSIDALYNSLSRSGRNAERLRATIQADYEQNVIDYRFNRTFVGNITGLKDEKLTSFMFRYRPGYYTTKTASDYEFISMIRANMKRFMRNNTRTYTLQPLIK